MNGDSDIYFTHAGALSSFFFLFAVYEMEGWSKTRLCRRCAPVLWCKMLFQEDA